MKDEALGKDEYDALTQIAAGIRGRPNACVARNVKRLAGLKFVAYAKDGSLSLTEKGEQTLFIHACINGLRAIAENPLAALAPEVKMFLGKKGHMVPRAGADPRAARSRAKNSQLDVTQSEL